LLAGLADALMPGKQEVDAAEVGTMADSGAEALPVPAEAGEDD